MKTFLCLICAGLISLLAGQQVLAGDPVNAKMLAGEKQKINQIGDMFTSLLGNVKEVIELHIEENAAANDGFFKIQDPITGNDRNLTIIDVHSNIAMKKGKYFSCVDFTDSDTGDAIDVDIFVRILGEDISVIGTSVHRVNGEVVDGSTLNE